MRYLTACDRAVIAYDMKFVKTPISTLAKRLGTTPKTVRNHRDRPETGTAVRIPPSTCKKELEHRRKVIAVAAEKMISGVRCALQSAEAIKDHLRAGKRNHYRVSKATVIRDLHASGFKSVVRPKTTCRDKNWTIRRIAFGKKELARQRADPGRYLNILFSDEKVFSSNDFSCRTQWRREGGVVHKRERKRWPKYRIMVWGCIGVGTRYLFIVPQKTHDKNGKPSAFSTDCVSLQHRCSGLPRHASTSRGHQDDHTP